MTTPMFKQWRELKALHPTAVLLFRMGDFYELFFQDAVEVAPLLDLALTSRNKNDPEPIPMAGFPVPALEEKCQRLVEAGRRVAIAEQVEDPAAAAGLVRRAIVRLVSPGVPYDPCSLAAGESNWLAAVTEDETGFGVAVLEASTGAFRAGTLPDADEVHRLLLRLEVKEVLLHPNLDGTDCDRRLKGIPRGGLDEASFVLREARRELKESLKLGDPRSLGLSGGAVLAAGAALRYARDGQGGRIGNVTRLEPLGGAPSMLLDETTRRNLEVFRTLTGGQRKGSLLGLLDRTRTGPGARLLREWLGAPLLDLRQLQRRQSGVAALVDSPSGREFVRQQLREVADLERIGARIAQGTGHGRDLAALRRSLEVLPDLVRQARAIPGLSPFLPTDVADDVRQDLARWLADEPPLALNEGGLIRPGANRELDHLVGVAQQGAAKLQALEEHERALTGITSLKLRHTRVFGYYLEVSKANLNRVPSRYLRKQTVSTGERYFTVELKELEDQLQGAEEKQKRLELELFLALRDRVGEALDRLTALARSLAELDALAALADCADRWSWCRPVLDDSRALELSACRHPVVEVALDEERFVANDAHLDPEREHLVVLTGPNMSGKSTYLRQVALAVLLAQIGSYVPAAEARIGLVDRIFTRVGAHDDLARGQSTFMVEMSETAAILHQATAQSLVVLDEIGRGTSTYDGLAIAWAVAEDLAVRLRCRAMFATHYHELCELADANPGVVNRSVAIAEHQGQILFLRRIKEGGASRSYGIQCARLAGLPAPVVQRASRLLQRFEKHAPRNERQQLSLFGGHAPAAKEEAAPALDPLTEKLRALEVDDLSPRDAHRLLGELVQLARSRS